MLVFCDGKYSLFVLGWEYFVLVDGKYFVLVFCDGKSFVLVRL